MEITIGVRQAPREITFSSDQDTEAIKKAVTKAFDGQQTVLELTDRLGRTFLVPTEGIAYVEIGSPDKPRVGFQA
ncbi:MAG: DUF3107 domain-containing protein [Bifidobacteriaceae bacterium]|jgi:hypothetical protein|nr:DUF3107 domain-containing protein [Bifidobacteriaceae bacterium]